MIKPLQVHCTDFFLFAIRLYPRKSQTFHYRICPWWLSTPTQWSWGGYCSSSWAALSNVSANKVWNLFHWSKEQTHLFTVCSVAERSESCQFRGCKDETRYVTFALRNRTHLIFYFFRIHSDHHDFGGVCATCCHDSHPRGQSICFFLTEIRGFEDPLQ